MPDYKDNASQGYMGDWKRGAPMGRYNVSPEHRSLAQLESEFVNVCKSLSDALNLKEKRPSDCWKASCWETAAADFRKQKEELRALIRTAADRAAYSPKVTLRRIYLDSGGYDSQGTYFGHDLPLFWAATDDGKLDETFRARNRSAAKEHVREIIPSARFYN